MEHVLSSRRFPTDPNEYKLYEEIGDGVSATVYRALCVPLDILVAIKVLDLEKCNNDLVSCVLWQISLIQLFTFQCNIFLEKKM
jgi:serine/threonine protein kinase